MNDHAGNMSMMTIHVPSPTEAERMVQQARQLFARTLSRWAADSLVLRRLQLDRLQWRPAQDQQGWSKAA